MDFLTNENLFSGRFHSFSAYTTAILSFAYGAWVAPNNLHVHAWLHGMLVPRNESACMQEVHVQLARALWIVHFVRRLVEVVWVHQYRRGASPLHMVFANCSYLFYGTIVAHSLRSDAYTSTCPSSLLTMTNSTQSMVDLLGGLCLFTLGECGNAYSHLQLRWAQDEAGRSQAREVKQTSWGKPQGKSIMSGGLFDYVTCAHFTYEILSWLGYAMVSGWAGAPKLVLVWSVGGLAMMAYDRHRKYVEYFDGSTPEKSPKYPSSRTSIIPFVF